MDERPRLRARELHWRALFWIGVAIGTVVALWPQPDPTETWLPGIDKVEHALSFALLTTVGLRAGFRSALVLAAGLVALGGAIELAQGLTATRTADWFDWLADAAGIALGWALSRLAAPRGVGSVGLEQEHGR